MPSGTSLEQYRRDDRDMLAVWERLEAAEATGRAAVRALERARIVVSLMDGLDARWIRQEIAAVLATDTARVWLREERTDGA